MRCLSCNQEVSVKDARLWERKIFLCGGCGELADKALAELRIALKRAEEQALMFLEQRIMSGGLLVPGTGMELPGLGVERGQ